MQGTKVEGTIGRLFEGHMHMFIECINVDYKSTRRESYMDLQLDVKGCKDIYSSFDKYCEVEVMDGQNQYQTDEHGMQVITDIDNPSRPVPFQTVYHLLSLVYLPFHFRVLRCCLEPERGHLAEKG